MSTQESIRTNQPTPGAREWLAIHTRYQHEHQVNELLTVKGFETFFPAFEKVHTWKDRKKKITHALFPGYLFVTNREDSRLPIVSTPGVCSIVSVAGVPVPINDVEIDAIRRATASPYAVRPHPYLKTGDHVCVRQGPLAGITGILARTEKVSRLVLTIELLGRAVAVEIESACVEPVKMVPAANG